MTKLNVASPPTGTDKLSGGMTTLGLMSRPSVAGALVTEPKAFVTTTSYDPSAVSVAEVNVSEGCVAPMIGAPLKRHCWLNGSTPETLAVNVALEPLRTCCAAGLTLAMAGAIEMRTGALVHDWNAVVT